jgi:hypothetical protein
MMMHDSLNGPILFANLSDGEATEVAVESTAPEAWTDSQPERS